MADSLKADIHSKRGKGVTRRVEPSSAVTGNWQQFLCIDDNKMELFSFLASNVAHKHLITTQDTGDLCSDRQDVSALAHLRRLTLVSSCTYWMPYNRGTAKCQYAQLIQTW